LSVPGTVGKELRSLQTQRTLLAVNPEEGYTWHMKKTFSDKVRDIVRKIPKSKTMTYKEVASKAGNPKAARAVGAVMRSNYDPSIPCHRVVASDGKMRGYNRGARIR
jgi:methylated-DNA-[protein]-cysteine S-methyltransferase